MAADQQLLKDIADAMSNLQSAISAATTARGTGGPQTPALQYLASVRTSINSVTSMGGMTNVYGQYGLNSDGTAVTPPTIPIPTAAS